MPIIFPENLQPMTTMDRFITRVAVRPSVDPSDSPVSCSSDSDRSRHHATPEMNVYRRRTAFQSFSIESLIGSGKDTTGERTAVRSPGVLLASPATTDFLPVDEHRRLSTLFTNMLDTAIVQQRMPIALESPAAEPVNFDYFKMLQLQSAAAAVGKMFSPCSLWPYTGNVVAFPRAPLPQPSSCYDNSHPSRGGHNRLSPPSQSFGCADEADLDSVDKSAGDLSFQHAEYDHDDDDDDDDDVDDNDAPNDRLHPLFGEYYKNV